MIRIGIETSGQPTRSRSGRRCSRPGRRSVKQPARTEMIENEIAKFENPLHALFSSCL